MQERVDLVLREQCAHGRLVADVAAHEQIARIALETGEVFDVAGIGQRIEHDHPARIAARQPMTHEIRADEAGPTGDQDVMRVVAHRAYSVSCAASGARAPARARASIPY